MLPNIRSDRCQEDHNKMQEVNGLSDITVRPFFQTDLEIVVEIAKIAWVPVFESYRRIMGDDIFDLTYPDWRGDKEAQIRKAAADDTPVHFLSAVVDGRVVGFVSWVIHSSSGAGEIGNNAVHPEYQNRGIAKMLYRQVFVELRKKGVRLVKVNTGLDQSHAPARSAYEKSGFSAGIPMVTYHADLERLAVEMET